MGPKLEKQGTIFDIQKYSIYDGPGTRTLVFLKGCPLRCKWCSNPEEISPKFEIMYSKDNCVSCGKCVEICPEGIHHIENMYDDTIIHKRNRNLRPPVGRHCKKSRGPPFD